VIHFAISSGLFAVLHNPADVLSWVVSPTEGLVRRPSTITHKPDGIMSSV
jgi:hypothetical protein